MATYLTAIGVDEEIDGKTSETAVDLTGDDDVARSAFQKPDGFRELLDGVAPFDYMLFPIRTICDYSISNGRWDPVRNSPDDTAGYATRFIRPCRIRKPHKFPTVIHCKELKTTKGGLRQDMHTDVHPGDAYLLDLFILLGNLSLAEQCTIKIGDSLVRLNPGRCVVFPAHLIHAGSGFKHASRLYVLFSSRKLEADEIAQAKKSSETLGFCNYYPPHYIGRR